MKQHLKLLARVPDISAILALRSLVPFEWGEFESTDRTPVLTVQSEVIDSEESRTLFVDGVPAVRVTVRGDEVDVYHEADHQPQDLGAALAAIGVPMAPPGQLACRIPLEQFHDRVCTIDAAWILLRRLRNCTDAESALRLAEQLLNLGLRSIQNQAAIVNQGNSPAREKASEQLLQEATALCREHSHWLHAIRLLGDPRGAALELRTAGFEHDFSMAALMFDWRPTVLAIDSQAARETHGSGRFAVRPTKLKQPVLDALSAASVSGKEVKLVQRLPKNLYGQVDEVLRTLGGQWSTSRQAHVFGDDADQVLERVLASGEIFRREDFEFFWTPAARARRVIDLAQLRRGMLVLEPSAGDGALALPAAEIVGKENVRVFELMPANVEKLREHGFAIDGPTDFLSTDPRPMFDAVLANPPFSGGRDVAHLQHAMRWLKPGGRLVAIASTTWQQQQSKAAEKFRALLSDLGAYVENVDGGEFKESGTDVPTTLIALNVAGVREPLPQPARPVLRPQGAEQQAMQQLAFF